LFLSKQTHKSLLILSDTMDIFCLAGSDSESAIGYVTNVTCTMSRTKSMLFFFMPLLRNVLFEKEIRRIIR